MGADVPAGFTPSRRTGPFFDLIGPVYTKTGERGIALGLRARTEHCNARGFVHAAVLAALLDVVCGRNCGARTPSNPNLLTVSLTVDYVAAAQDGDWLEASATVTRVGRRLAFADGMVETAGRPVAKASAIFAVA
jgi:uncharacterized protein (TIGR00369 family)